MSTPAATATVDSAEVEDDSVILGITVTATGAEGARPGPPERVYQSLAVAGAEITEIRGGPRPVPQPARPGLAEDR
ncbi:MAG TPA: hypothetical protein VMU95_15865 [Trebonia sp.]|nr:hypothetical protein [Trebonia sp.]